MKIKVGVFYGGRSVEHEVSILSALQAIHAIDREKYDVVPVYITKRGQFYTGEQLLDVENYKDMDKLLSSCRRVTIIDEQNEKVIVRYPASRFGSNIVGKIDVAFPVIHGTNGEDGTLQGFLESIDIPYVGCDILASAVGMDKVVMKRLMKEDGLPVLDYVSFSPKQWLKDSENIVKKIESELKYPVIVKPANLGSSVGVKKAGTKNELEDAIDAARCFSNKILVEVAVVKLKEINCSVLGDYERAEASVCEEPFSNDEILSYKDKYLNKSGSKGMSGSMRNLPANIPIDMTRHIQQLAVQTFQTLGCAGVSRVDFLVDNSTDKVYVNEINTIPGSLSFYLWEASGKSFTQLTSELIQLALKRSREKSDLIFSYDTNILSLKGGTKGSKQ